MSAGPAPPNPGTPRSNSRAPAPSILPRRGPLIAASVAVGLGAYFFFAKRPPLPEGTPEFSGKTPGIKNIEGAYTNAGATSTHTKAYGGTPMGDKDNEELREHSGAGTGAPKGVKSGAFGDDQRPSTNTKVEKMFQKSQYGDEKGK